MLDSVHLSKSLARLPLAEAELSDPATPSNQKRYRALLQEHASLTRLRGFVERYTRLEREVAGHRELMASDDADPDLRELAAAELDALEASLAVAERDVLTALLPPDESERRNAIIEIRAGTGGDEAALFAGDLLRMYTKYCAGRGWRLSVVDASVSNLGGYKDVVCTVEGEGAYGVLRYEGGVHRVQRVPATEASGRIHTSAATVAVFPEADESDELDIPPDDIRVDIFCASGPGGQGVNTTYSAIRLTHVPTGIVAQSQDERSQHRNKEKAMAVLKARLLDARRREEEARMGSSRRSMIGTGDRSERIRTYNFPQNRLTDHRINLTMYSLDRVMEGAIDDFLAALKAQDVQLRMEKEMKASEG